MNRVAVCAAGEAAWHAAAYAGLGAQWTYADGIAFGTTPHRFLLGAVTLAPMPRLPSVLQGTLRDSWAVLARDALPGWTSRAADPWMYREPAPCSPQPVDGVTVERTEDALLFERTAFVAAGGRPPTTPGELHPAGSAGVPGLFLFLARRNAEAIGTALAVVHDAGVVVSAVSVAAAERRRGVGALLTAAVLSVAPDRPATLSASELGAGTYLRLGFVEVGRGVDWVHAAQPSAHDPAT